MTNDIVNHCEYKGMMSCCVKKEEQEEQKKCSYYIKASYFNRCIYLKYDEYCDCIDAIQKKKETRNETKR